MAWNESGGGKSKDPWGGGNRKTPPDLDEVFQRLQQKLQGIFAFKKRSGSNGKKSTSKVSVGLITVIALAIWALSGIFIVSPAEEGVVLRFGKYVKTVGPGPHWIPRFIESKEIINVEKIYNFAYSAEMLNMDENIVSVSVAIQYRIEDPENFLFKVVDPVATLQEATASSLRQVVGHTTLDEVLTTGREQVRQEVERVLASVLGNYNTGILITDVALQPARAPDQVKDAFDDAIKAQEDEQRYVNQAQGYVASVLPIAQGQAKRIMEEASAYKERVILISQGDTARFLALLSEYTQAPEVTRNRLYIDALESVFSRTNKVFIDAQGTNNLFYLPLDQLLQQSSGSQGSSSRQATASNDAGGGSGANNQQIPMRTGRESYPGRGGVR